jgi:hypothetical protein
MTFSLAIVATGLALRMRRTARYPYSLDGDIDLFAISKSLFNNANTFLISSQWQSLM